MKFRRFDSGQHPGKTPHPVSFDSRPTTEEGVAQVTDGSTKSLFISYARADVDTAQSIATRLGNFDHFSFVDDQLRAGQDWWEVILEHIRTCPIFVCIVSPSYTRSRACKAELSYAHALGKTIIPLKVRDVSMEDAPDILQKINVTDFVNPTERSFAELDTVLDEAKAAPDAPLPDPLPESPATPMADVAAAREMIGRASLTLEDQQQLVTQLGAQVQDEDDRPAAVALLEQLATHPDRREAIARDVSELLSRYRLAPTDAQSMKLMKSVVRALTNEQLTPIVGSGMTDWLVGSRKTLAQEWAHEYNYPLNLSQRDDLPQVAQYISVTEKDQIMRQDLARFYRQQLKEKFPDIVEGAIDGPRAFPLDDGIVKVWHAASDRMPAEPHKVLATLPCRIYINAEPTTLLSEALRTQLVKWPDGQMKPRAPREDFCRWNHDAVEEAPPSPFETEPDYVPSIEKPLVFHIFGTLQYPESIVITEDDYFDFIGAVAESPELIPIDLRAAVAESSLLLLGLGLQDWDVRVLLRALVNREIAESLGKNFKHVAADTDAGDGDGDGVVSVDGAKEYLREYFGEFRDPKISIFWASVEAFCEGLEHAWFEQTNGSQA